MPRPLVLVAAILALGASSCALAGAKSGGAAPALVVKELNGQTFDLAAMRGKIVVVSFWATWCPPCRAEMPQLDAFYRRYHSRGVELIGVSADDSWERAKVVQAMKAFHYPAAMLADAQSNGFGEPAVLPVTYVIDRNGIVRAKFTPDKGPLTEQGLAAVLLPLLGGRS
ncbi:MAG: TlpA family protein disulfide reductase [Candidatus Binataceae bacterium]